MAILKFLFLLLGFTVGSFLNVCIYRIPRNESLLFPQSHCPNCQNPIKIWDNIPLLSYLILKGRCRVCKNKISIIYPFTELLTGILYFALFIKFGLSLRFFLSIFFVSSLIIIGFIDLKHKIIPNRLIIPLIIASFIFLILLFLGKKSGVLPLVGNQKPVYSIYGFLAAGGFLLIIAMIKEGGMGGGDIKLAGFMGIFLGFYVGIALFIGFIVGGITGIFLIILNKKTRKDLIPFGPYLCFGSLISIFWGQKILELYLRTTGL
ncbi:MAG: prepilin peptidase [Actinobacteria bacterium]|nr:prepilin peptidase [Actinomycetota bacterium]